MSSTLELSIIIVSFNNADAILKCIDTIYEYTKGVSFEIIMVDNNSSERNIELVSKTFPNVIIISNKYNVGYGKANNQGVKIAKGYYIAIVNPDILLVSNIFNKLIDQHRYTLEDSVVGVGYNRIDGGSIRSFFKFPSLIQRFLILSGIKKFIINRGMKMERESNALILSVDYIGGAFMLMKREIFNLIDGFDENFFMYHEEMDLCYRLRRTGFEIISDRGNRIIKNDNNFEVPDNKFAFIERNRSILYFYKKHFSKMRLIMLIMLNIIAYNIRIQLSLKRQHNMLYKEVVTMNWAELNIVRDIRC